METGDFSDMLAAFAVDAVLTFHGIPVGPFRGRAAIEEAYRSQPPGDEIVLLSTEKESDTIVATYAWTTEPETRAGEMRLRYQDGAIAALDVIYER